ncbi:MAG: hypothetical protein ACLR8P_12000 [Clostridium fessum]
MNRDDLDLNYDNVVELFKSGKLAMYFGSSSGVKMFQDQGIHTTFLPFFKRMEKMADDDTLFSSGFKP